MIMPLRSQPEAWETERAEKDFFNIEIIQCFLVSFIGTGHVLCTSLPLCIGLNCVLPTRETKSSISIHGLLSSDAPEGQSEPPLCAASACFSFLPIDLAVWQV